MFSFTSNPFDTSEKGLLRSWRSQFRARIARHRYARRLAKRIFSKMHQISSVNRCLSQTARLYNEIRLLKNAFYAWFRASIPDRLAFARANELTHAHRQSLKFGVLAQWARRCQSITTLQRESQRFDHLKRIKLQLKCLATWRLLHKQHSTRLIWTENFRATEDLRAAWQDWRRLTAIHIQADVFYQRALALGCLNQWRNLFESRQDRRWSLLSVFKKWKQLRLARQAQIYFSGQRTLRRLNAFDAPAQSLSASLQLPESKQALLIALYKWHFRLDRLLQLELAGDGMILESLKKKLRCWRLATINKLLPRQQPRQLVIKMIRRLKRHVLRAKEKKEAGEVALMQYYTSRAWTLQRDAFSLWESRFQMRELGKRACDARLKQWQAAEQWLCLHRWQLQTALKIHTKCTRWTQRQSAFTQWRQICASEKKFRMQRIKNSSLTSWRAALKSKLLQKIEGGAWRSVVLGSRLNRWQEKKNSLTKAASLAEDFYYLTRSLSTLKSWQLKAKEGRGRRRRSIKPPTAHLLKPKKIEVPSLSDLNAVLVEGDGELSVAELSV